MSKIKSHFAISHAPLAEATQDQIRTLPMLYRASREFARSLNNPVINDFLANASESGFRYESLDIKVCMLKQGWWPCIPGWHLDDFHRGIDGQPALDQLENYRCRHIMALHGDSSLTQFCEGEFELPPFVLDQPVYGWYNKQINRRYSCFQTIESRRVYEFTESDFHRGVEATHDGWRAFFRLTQSNHREPKNEIRSQVQIYVPQAQFFRGW
jgi:hypothetical protein